jgi:hypothetical protein
MEGRMQLHIFRVQSTMYVQKCIQLLVALASSLFLVSDLRSYPLSKMKLVVNRNRVTPLGLPQ